MHDLTRLYGTSGNGAKLHIRSSSSSLRFIRYFSTYLGRRHCSFEPLLPGVSYALHGFQARPVFRCYHRGKPCDRGNMVRVPNILIFAALNVVLARDRAKAVNVVYQVALSSLS